MKQVLAESRPPGLEEKQPPPQVEMGEGGNTGLVLRWLGVGGRPMGW